MVQDRLEFVLEPSSNLANELNLFTFISSRQGIPILEGE